MRILDLGCGAGTGLVKLGVTESDEVTGVDIDNEALVIARQRFPKRAFCAGAAENLPFANASFDRVISNVAIPYMDIPTTLLEMHRVLVPGGQVWASVHPASFTMAEIRMFWGMVCGFTQERLYGSLTSAQSPFRRSAE